MNHNKICPGQNVESFMQCLTLFLNLTQYVTPLVIKS